MSCHGLHCPGCGSGGRGLLALGALGVGGLIACRAVTSPAAEHAAGEALTVAVICAAVLGGLVVVAAVVAAVVAYRRAVTRRAAAVAAVPGPDEYPPLRLVASRALPDGRTRIGLPAAQEPAGARRGR